MWCTSWWWQHPVMGWTHLLYNTWEARADVATALPQQWMVSCCNRAGRWVWKHWSPWFLKPSIQICCGLSFTLSCPWQVQLVLESTHLVRISPIWLQGYYERPCWNLAKAKVNHHYHSASSIETDLPSTRNRKQLAWWGVICPWSIYAGCFQSPFDLHVPDNGFQKDLSLNCHMVWSVADHPSAPLAFVALLKDEHDVCLFPVTRGSSWLPWPSHSWGTERRLNQPFLPLSIEIRSILLNISLLILRQSPFLPKIFGCPSFLLTSSMLSVLDHLFAIKTKQALS